MVAIRLLVVLLISLLVASWQAIFALTIRRSVAGVDQSNASEDLAPYLIVDGKVLFVGSAQERACGAGQ